MTARVRIDGTIWLDRIASVSQLVDSTVYRSRNASDSELGFSGDYQASCLFGTDQRFSASWWGRGKTFEIFEPCGRTWGGLTRPPEAVDGAWRIVADGYGAQAADMQGLSGGSVSMVPNAVVDDARTNRGAKFFRTATLSASAVGTTSGEFVNISTILDRGSQALGKRWWTDSLGEITFVSDPTQPLWSTTPNPGYVGTADDQFYSRMYGYFVSAMSGGVPSAWGVVSVIDAEAEKQFGIREVIVDLTPLGLMTSPTAATNIANRFGLVGARMGWTEGVELSALNLRKLGVGPAHPLAMHGRDGAGQILRMPGVLDTRSQTVTRGSIQFILGEVERDHDAQLVRAKPQGLVARDFASAIAAAQPPVSDMVVV